MPQKCQHKNNAGLPYPGLLRRRLSAPEIIMRKYSLARQNSDSVDSESTQASTPSTLQPLYSRSIWGRISNTGSDSNLSFRKNSNTRNAYQNDSIRRNTLLRCMQTRSRETEASNSTEKLDCSINTVKTQEFTPDSLDQHKSFTDRSKITSNTSSDFQNNNSSGESTFVNHGVDHCEKHKIEILSTSSLPSSVNSTLYSSSSHLQTPQTTSSENENMKNVLKDSGSDSVNANSPRHVSDNKSAELNNDSEKSNQNEVSFDLEVNREGIEKRVNIVSNVNVTANTVNLIMHSDSEMGSLPTLSDDNKAISEPNKNNNDANNVTSFYLKPKEDVRITPEHSRLIKYMISNIRAGSIYTKPFGEAPLVIPRYSAVPRTTSMEVNASSPDSTDKESDTASLVDSLDESQSPRQSAVSSRLKYDDKPVRGDLSALLPENVTRGETPTPKVKVQKSAAFFIPMLSEDSMDKDVKTVSERMPDKVRDKLDKRKQKIDQKKHKPLDFSYHDPFKDHGNKGLIATTGQLRFKSENIDNSTLRRKHKSDDRSRVIATKKLNKVPDINSNTFPIRKNKKYNRVNRKKYVNIDENENSSGNTSYLHHSSTSLASTPVDIGEREVSKNHKYYKPEQNLNKKIEILEIKEETSSGEIFYHNAKSKIPVPVHHKPEEHNDKLPVNYDSYCPYSLEDMPADDPKVDQLIANLLIDTLNKPDEEYIPSPKPADDSEKRPNYITTTKHNNSNWYKHKFEMIPEEKSVSIGSPNENSNQPLSPSALESDNNNIVASAEAETQVEIQEMPHKVKKNSECFFVDASSQTDIESAGTDVINENTTDCRSNGVPINKGKAALNKTQSGDVASIPKGWITFYMLRKNPSSSNSSTDEGPLQFSGRTTKPVSDEEKDTGIDVKSVVAKRKLSNKEDALINDNQVDKLDANMNGSSDGLEKFRKGHFTSSSEFKSQTLSSDHDSEKQSICPSLPLASYLPLRKNRRLNQRKSRLKITHNSWHNNSELPGEWSVTVTGVNSRGQPVPDLEMRLKFPNSRVTSQSDSGFGEDNQVKVKTGRQQQPTATQDKTGCLPPAPRKYTVITKKVGDFLDKDLLNEKSFHYLPDLIKNKNKRIISKEMVEQVEQVEQGVQGVDCEEKVVRMPVLAPVAAARRPRQTLTSYRRFSLRHGPHLPTHLQLCTSADGLRPRELVQLPECLANHLSVMGSAIHRVPANAKTHVNKYPYHF